MSSVVGRSLEAPFPPTWLCDFAREVRCRLSPILERDRQGVWAALVRWRDTYNEHSRLHFERQTRRGEAARPRLNALPGSIWPERPVVGRVWNDNRIDREGEAPDGEPPFDFPLPPPDNRDPTGDECVAAMIAIHDEVWDSRQRVGPDVGDGAGDEWWPFQLLRICVRGLTEVHLAALHRMLETAAGILTPPVAAGEDAGNEQHPDGPEAGCRVWYGGRFVEVSGRIYAVNNFMWRRESVTYDELKTSVNSEVQDKSVHTWVNRANNALTDLGLSWDLVADGSTRFVRKRRR